MNRATFQRISSLRLREARTLLHTGHYDGAYYLTGYAVECALKACIAKQARRYDFPDRKLAQEAFTHDLEKLIRVAGLATDFHTAIRANNILELNWAIAKDWSEESRYELGTTEAEARDLFNACSARNNGVLGWIKSRW